jgi:hypothetical protein
MLSELCDDTNSAKAFSYIGIATGFGRLVGPTLGGLLSQPAVKYPAIFAAGGVFGRNPFLLPCVACAAITLAAFVLGTCFLRETLGRDGFAKLSTSEPQRAGGGGDASVAGVGSGASTPEMGDAEAIGEAEEGGMLTQRRRRGSFADGSDSSRSDDEGWRPDGVLATSSSHSSLHSSPRNSFGSDVSSSVTSQASDATGVPRWKARGAALQPMSALEAAAARAQDSASAGIESTAAATPAARSRGLPQTAPATHSRGGSAMKAADGALAEFRVAVKQAVLASEDDGERDSLRLLSPSDGGVSSTSASAAAAGLGPEADYVSDGVGSGGSRLTVQQGTRYSRHVHFATARDSSTLAPMGVEAATSHAHLSGPKTGCCAAKRRSSRLLRAALCSRDSDSAGSSVRGRTSACCGSSTLHNLLTCGGGPCSYFRTLRRLMNDRGVAVSTCLYALLAAVGMIATEMWPLYVINDVQHGGFSWTSQEVGLLVSVCGPFLLLWNLFVYARVVRWLGLFPTVRLCFGIHAVTLAATPLCSLALRLRPQPDAADPSGLSPPDIHKSPVEWIALGLVFILATVSRVSAFTCVFVLVANSALPADRSTVNGLGQALASLVRAVGPPVGTALFAWSVSPANTAAGWPWDFHFTWYLMALLSLAALGLSYMLPSWIDKKRPAPAAPAAVASAASGALRGGTAHARSGGAAGSAAAASADDSLVEDDAATPTGGRTPVGAVAPTPAAVAALRPAVTAA